MKKSYFVSLLLFVALFIGAIITSGGRILTFINIPSIIMVAATTFVLLMGSFSLPEMGRCFSAAFADSEATRGELEIAAAFFSSMTKYLLLSGGLGTLVGSITMLSQLTMADKIGFGAALSLMTVLYALILISVVSLPFQAGIKKKAARL